MVWCSVRVHASFLRVMFNTRYLLVFITFPNNFILSAAWPSGYFQGKYNGDGFGINFHTADNFLMICISRKQEIPLSITMFSTFGWCNGSIPRQSSGRTLVQIQPLGLFFLISQLTQVLTKCISLFRLNYSYPLGGVNGSMPRQ